MDAYRRYYRNLHPNAPIRCATIAHTDSDGNLRTRYIYACGYVDLHAEAIAYAAGNINTGSTITISYPDASDGYIHTIGYANSAAVRRAHLLRSDVG